MPHITWVGRGAGRDEDGAGANRNWAGGRDGVQGGDVQEEHHLGSLSRTGPGGLAERVLKRRVPRSVGAPRCRAQRHGRERGVNV